MSREPVSAARADELILAYAREHREPIGEVTDLARSSGLVLATGSLHLVGARWFLYARTKDTRCFRVSLPDRSQRRARTVEVHSRVRLAVNLRELGYGEVMAGRMAYRAWKDGHATASTGRVIAQEVTA